MRILQVGAAGSSYRSHISYISGGHQKVLQPDFTVLVFVVASPNVDVVYLEEKVQDEDEDLAAGPSCPESRTSQESRTWEGGSQRSKVIMAGGGCSSSLPDLIPTPRHLKMPFQLPEYQISLSSATTYVF